MFHVGPRICWRLRRGMRENGRSSGWAQPFGLSNWDGRVATCWDKSPEQRLPDWRPFGTMRNLGHGDPVRGVADISQAPRSLSRGRTSVPGREAQGYETGYHGILAIGSRQESIYQSWGRRPTMVTCSQITGWEAAQSICFSLWASGMVRRRADQGSRDLRSLGKEPTPGARNQINPTPYLSSAASSGWCWTITDWFQAFNTLGRATGPGQHVKGPGAHKHESLLCLRPCSGEGGKGNSWDGKSWGWQFAKELGNKSKKHAGGKIGNNCHPLVTKRTESNFKGNSSDKGSMGKLL